MGDGRRDAVRGERGDGRYDMLRQAWAYLGDGRRETGRGERGEGRWEVRHVAPGLGVHGVVGGELDLEALVLVHEGGPHLCRERGGGRVR
jgi:hypothetical protein